MYCDADEPVNHLQEDKGKEIRNTEDFNHYSPLSPTTASDLGKYCYICMCVDVCMHVCLCGCGVYSQMSLHTFEFMCVYKMQG